MINFFIRSQVDHAFRRLDTGETSYQFYHTDPQSAQKAFDAHPSMGKASLTHRPLSERTITNLKTVTGSVLLIAALALTRFIYRRYIVITQKVGEQIFRDVAANAPHVKLSVYTPHRGLTRPIETPTFIDFSPPPKSIEIVVYQNSVSFSGNELSPSSILSFGLKGGIQTIEKAQEVYQKANSQWSWTKMTRYFRDEAGNPYGTVYFNPVTYSVWGKRLQPSKIFRQATPKVLALYGLSWLASLYLLGQAGSNLSRLTLTTLTKITLKNKQTEEGAYICPISDQPLACNDKVIYFGEQAYDAKAFVREFFDDRSTFKDLTPDILKSTIQPQVCRLFNISVEAFVEIFITQQSPDKHILEFINPDGSLTQTGLNLLGINQQEDRDMDEACCSMIENHMVSPQTIQRLKSNQDINYSALVDIPLSLDSLEESYQEVSKRLSGVKLKVSFSTETQPTQTFTFDFSPTPYLYQSLWDDYLERNGQQRPPKLHEFLFAKKQEAYRLMKAASIAEKLERSEVVALHKSWHMKRFEEEAQTKLLTVEAVIDAGG